MNRTPLAAAAAAAFTVAPLAAQTFTDLTESRNVPQPFTSIFQVEAGAIGTIADDRDVSVGLDDDISWDARLYYRDEAFGSRKGTIAAYAGRDGLYASYADGKIVGDDTVTRFEFRGRPWMFYRDGFYRDDQLVPNGFYEGSDYEGYIGFGKEAQQSLYIEIGPFYRALDFRRSELTPVTFAEPEDFSAYGARIYLEQAALQMDRKRGLPREGHVITLNGEREWNDSEGGIGGGAFVTELPSAVWRLRGRLEWYIPGSDTTCWEVFALGGWHDEKDRIQSSEGQRPLGNQWADAQLRLRWSLSNSVTLTPYFNAQYSRVLAEDGFDSDREFFFGGGADLWIHFGERLSMQASYSYLDNENRPSISIDEDLHGQQMFYAGMALRIGTAARR